MSYSYSNKIDTNISDGWERTITVTDGFVDETITVSTGTGEAIEYIKPVAFPNCWVVTRKDLANVKKVIFNPPATIVIWADGHKEVVKCSEDEDFNCEVGVAMCFVKRIFDSRNQFIKLVDNAWNDYCEGYLKDLRYHEDFIKQETAKIKVRKKRND